jgi:threonine dehydratase
VALAAALFRPELIEGNAVIVVATGGNVDADTFAATISGCG